MVLDGQLGLYGLKYDSVTACGLPLYLCSYKLYGSATRSLPSGPSPCVDLRLLGLLGMQIFTFETFSSEVLHGDTPFLYEWV